MKKEIHNKADCYQAVRMAYIHINFKDNYHKRATSMENQILE